MLFVTLHGLDWAAFLRILEEGHYEFLLLTVPVAVINYFLRALRWSILVRAGEDVPIPTIFWANMLGYMGNSYLPARAGEILRSAFLGRKSGLGTSFVLATALAERMFDAMALVLIGSIALLQQGYASPVLTRALGAMAIAAAIGLGVVTLAPFREGWILSMVASLPLPGEIPSRISKQVARLLAGMRSLLNPARMGAFALLTLVIWLVDAIANTLGVRIVSETLTIGQSLVLLAGLGLSSAIPSTPGYLGVYQFVAVTVLVPFGFSRAGALAYILISQATTYILVTILGLIALLQLMRASPAAPKLEE